MSDRLAAAWEAFRAADAVAAEQHARAVVEDRPDHGPAWYALACALERQNRLREADRAFARANRVKDEPQELPFRVPWSRFLRAVEQAKEVLPRELRGGLAEVTIILADYADPHQLDGFDEPELLGLFEGDPRGEGTIAGSPSPRIHLWRRAHEHAVGGAKAFDAEVRTTLHHELGHYLGFDEQDLERFGLG